jgi:photosystem II stability/assembly factor-like uncharacterized protein
VPALPPWRFARHSAVLLLAVGAGSLDAQPRRTPTRASTAALPAVGLMAAPFDTALLGGLTWRNIGPARGGRSVAVAGSVKRPMEFWMGTTGGGVFKTTDGGSTWAPASDRYFGGTIGAIAVAPSNPDIVYVGGGEFPIRGNVSHGDGMWKSIDAGRTWARTGFDDSRHFSKIRVHPENPDIVYAAVFGHVFGPSKERGIYKSVDGGKSWKQVLFRNDSTAAIDLSMDPFNPNVLYAALWEAYRKPWMLVSGGEGSGIFKSTDAGETWTEITRNPGMPKGLIGNIGLSASAAKPNLVWAIIENDSGGVYKSDDAGATWTKTNSERKLRQRAWYYTKIHADTKDPNAVWVNNVSFHKSTDGGKTFRAISAPHGDSHDFWQAPDNPMRMIEANDGGANVSMNGGRAWSAQTFATAQFYHVTTTNHYPYKICGAQQDNSTLCGPSRNPGGIGINDWQDAGGGESGFISASPTDPDIVFAGSYGGYLTRKDMRTGFERDINPWPLNPMGHSASDAKYRMQWTFPVIISPHNPKVLYVGSNVIFKSLDEGGSYTPISPDLTRADPRTLGPSGGPITKDQTGVETYATVFTIAESPRQAGVIWAGSDDGVVQVTRDAGKSWTNVTPPLLKEREWMRISMIEASPHDAGTAYLSGNRYQLDDFEPYFLKTTDFGKTWSRIDRAGQPNGIAMTHFARVLREDPARRGFLVAGTERMIYGSLDDGATWFSLRRNMPIVPVHDLVFKDNDIVVASHGRSFFVMDDISVLRQLAPTVASTRAHLFRPAVAVRTPGGGGFGGFRFGAGVGPNPPSGAITSYWLADPNRRVALEYADSTGRVVQRFSSEPDSATVADSVRRITQRQQRMDSLKAAGLSPDSITRLMAPPVVAEGGPPDMEALMAQFMGGGGARAPRLPNKRGVNMYAWNLREADASRFDGMIMWAGSTTGPMVPPGRYVVRLLIDGQSVATQSLDVRKDPRVTATQADLVAQYELLKQIRDRTTAANDAVKTSRNVKSQLTDRSGQLAAPDKPAFSAMADPLATELSDVEGDIYQVRNQSGQDPLNYPIKVNNQIAALVGVVGSTDARPTAQSYTVFGILSKELEGYLVQMKKELDTKLPAINAFLKSKGLQEIKPAPTDAKPKIAADDDADGSAGSATRQRW